VSHFRRLSVRALGDEAEPVRARLLELVPATTIGDDLLSTLRALYSPVAPFGYRLTRVEAFPTVAWLAPEPAAPFLELIARTFEALPDHPPYGDPLLEPVPHCTVGVVDAPAALQPVLDGLRAGLEPLLPIRCEARAATLLEERDDRTWVVHTRFPFEGAA
jgi:2'-5' RNA ligase